MHLLLLLAVGLVILVGVVGIIVPVLPGAVLVLAAIAAWAAVEHTAQSWLVLGVAAVAIVASQVIKYVLPDRSLRAHGIPSSTTLIGAAVGVIGFFVIPVVGMPVGFLVGVFGCELRRSRSARLAVTSTWAAVRAAGLSMLIELIGASVAATAWLGYVVFG